DLAGPAVPQVDLALDHVGPGGRAGVLEVGHEHLRAGVEGVDDHLAVGRTGDLDAAVLEAGRLGLDRPVALADLAGLGEEVGELARVELSLPFDASLEQVTAARPEAALELGDELDRLRGQDL